MAIPKFVNALLWLIIPEITVLNVVNCQQSDWTHFRGDKLNGISAEKSAPLKWNDSLNIAWKTRIEGLGWSSPVVYGSQIWLTSASDDGKQLFANCIDFKTGKEVFRIKVLEPAKVYPKHEMNTYATPTPCIEQGFVYVHFGTYGTVCLSTNDGKVVWNRTDLNCDHVQGPASCPVIYQNMLILHIEGADVQYIVALDKSTGKTIWKTDRPKELYDKLKPIGKKSYMTPIIINVNGRDLLISPGSAACIAYDVHTGEEVWRVVQGEDSTIAMPVTEKGTLFFYSSFVTDKEGKQYSELIAVDPTGSGDVTGTKVLWRLKLPVLQLSSPVLRNGLIYNIDSKNNISCIEAETGNVIYSKRLQKKYNASPVIAGGNVYLTSMDGETTIIREGRTFEMAGKNKIEGEVFATPAILRNSVIIRTKDFLLKVSENKN
jgi:outer membrane protein assembly factor BamB